MRARAEQLFDRHHLAVFRYFRRMTGSPDLAQDLTQDVFLRVLEALPRYREQGREVAWVFRIARDVLAGHWHKVGHLPDTSGDVEAVAVPSTQVAAFGFHEALQLLKALDREVFLLREQAGLSYMEIADACGISEEAVRSRMYRARREIRRLLTGRLADLDAWGSS